MGGARKGGYVATTDNRQTFERYLKEVWEHGHLDTLDEYLSPAFHNNDPVPGIPDGRPGERKLIEMFRAAFDNFTTNVDTAMGEGDKLAVRWSAEGTHVAQFAGVPPSGKRIKMLGVEHLRFDDGKIAEVWINFDMAGLMQQLGATPAQG
jgi:steroid delta-isomerase-like uncharacterized protein